jgi:hypothetical protein
MDLWARNHGRRGRPHRRDAASGPARFGLVQKLTIIWKRAFSVTANVYDSQKTVQLCLTKYKNIYIFWSPSQYPHPPSQMAFPRNLPFGYCVSWLRVRNFDRCGSHFLFLLVRLGLGGVGWGIGGGGGSRIIRSSTKFTRQIKSQSAFYGPIGEHCPCSSQDEGGTFFCDLGCSLGVPGEVSFHEKSSFIFTTTF